MPNNVEALNFIANRQQEHGHLKRSTELMFAAHGAQLQDPAALPQLGEVQMLAGDLEAATDGLDIAPGMFVARLRLGVALEQLGRRDEAVPTYLAAIDAAQAQGRCLSDTTTAPGLRDAIKHATPFAAASGRTLFDAIIEPLQQRYGRSELARVDERLATYRGEQVSALLASSGTQGAAMGCTFLLQARYAPRSAVCALSAYQRTAGLDAVGSGSRPRARNAVLGAASGTHILPHRGVTNTRLVTHLPLVVPPDRACAWMAKLTRGRRVAA